MLKTDFGRVRHEAETLFSLVYFVATSIPFARAKFLEVFRIWVVGLGCRLSQFTHKVGNRRNDECGMRISIRARLPSGLELELTSPPQNLDRRC